MTAVDIRFLLEVNNAAATIQSREGVIAQVSEKSTTADIRHKIVLPNQIKINITKSTTTGNIQLKKIWLGGIEFNANALVQICSYKNDQDSDTVFDTFWGSNGEVTIELFDKDFITYHLHLGNTLGI
jgi:hypothetical protein